MIILPPERNTPYNADNYPHLTFEEFQQVVNHNKAIKRRHPHTAHIRRRKKEHQKWKLKTKRTSLSLVDLCDVGGIDK